MKYVLVPGRHHIVTDFLTTYLRSLPSGLQSDKYGIKISMDAPPVTFIWAVTSANHSGTRRNPLTFPQRQAQIELASARASLNSLVVPIFDTTPTERFAEITLKAIEAELGLVLTPDNTIFSGSTPAVIEMYEALGFRIAQAELSNPEVLRPWDVLELMANGDPAWRQLADPASRDFFERYNLIPHITTLMTDPVVGDEGDLTTTREYRSYTASFEHAAQRKWESAKPHIKPGRILDIGCASGGMLEQMGKEPTLSESDLFGIELSRTLYQECLHKKDQGLFQNPNTFFLQANILSGPVFPERSIDTTLSYALTHEIVSYANGITSLKEMARLIYAQTRPSGVWINSDVLGPEQGDRLVRLNFKTQGPTVPAVDLYSTSTHEVESYLESISFSSRFVQFVKDFSQNAHTDFDYELVGDSDNATGAITTLSNAIEFLTKYSYTNNYLSETHERFTALDYPAWLALLTEAGFTVLPTSHPWQNEWVINHIFEPCAALTTPEGKPVPWPDTHVFTVAQRPLNT